MSTLEQRKRLKAYWGRGCVSEPFPDDLRGLACGAKTRAGTPCKLTAIYDNGRCKFHGGASTGPKTAAGKTKAALNGLKPKRKKQSS